MSAGATLIKELSERARGRFKEERRLLSFEDYLALVSASPRAHTRDAVTFTRDAFDHFGVSDVERPYGTLRRFHLFDDPLPSGEPGPEAVAGQELAQARMYELLCDFEREGRANRLILLHGPNGSAKSSLVRCVAKALERYSELPEGALYTFSWVFPSKRAEGSAGIGFGSSSPRGEGPSTYAYLSGSELEARVPCETRDHPLLLLPKEARVAWLTEQLGADARLPKSLLEGELSPKSAQIFEALLKRYQGDLSEVLKHVQVERFSSSRRYRRALSTVDPQMRVDAHARQVTADRSLAALPHALQHLNLYEAGGHLVEGNRGLIEYNDLLKRPLEAFKYLLATCESGAVRLETLTLYLDAVLIGSCNFEHLEAFKESPEFSSFKGRLELIEVPYLRDIEQERKIYAPQLKALSAELELTPDLDWALASWGVMTRLERPQKEQYEEELGSLVAQLDAFDKATLYSTAQAPERLSYEERRAITQALKQLYHEAHPAPLYEGLIGASPRELKALLLSLAHEAHAAHAQAIARGATPARPTLTPLTLFKALRALCEQRDLYPFLKRQGSGGFYQPLVFVQQLEDLVFKRLEERFERALGWVEEQSVSELFERYLSHVMCTVKGERLHNPLTGAYEPPDEALMSHVEGRLKRPHSAEARATLLQRVGSWRLDHPEASLDYAQIFPLELKVLRESYLEERRARTLDELEGVCQLLRHTPRAQEVQELQELQEDQSDERAREVLAHLEREGYPQQSALEMLSALYARLKR